jgi:uncharacterized protein (DUF1330 family)
MQGYVVIDTEVIDAEAYSEFVEKVPAVLAAHGGRFLVRSSDAETIEGDWAPKRLVILEFGSMEAARGFVDAAYHGDLGDIRRRATTSKIVVAEGCDAGG